MKNRIILALSVLLMACNSTPTDPEPEDYDKLFPFKGIDKPEISYEDMIHQQCDISNYQYPGVEIPQSREYTVTITCKYKKGREKNAIPSFFVKYVALDKNLKVIGSNPKSSNVDEVLEDNKEKTITMKLPSGYPMYLSVSGQGDRESRIEATIKAVSTDGVLVVPELTYVITQNKVGINQIIPYCEYIVLP